MTFKQIQDLIKQVDKSGIGELKIKEENFSISITSEKAFGGETLISQAPAMVQAAPVAVQVPTTAAPTIDQAKPEALEKPTPAAEGGSGNGNLFEFKSPMIGTLYRKPSPDKECFVQVGDKVKTGDVLCVIEAMKLFNEIEYEGEGTIAKVLVDDASPVEYDQPLFLIEPA